MPVRTRSLLVLCTVVLSVTWRPAAAQVVVPTPDEFAGFEIGTDGELVPYPKVLEYFQLLAEQTDRVQYEELGRTTLDNVYALVRISSAENLARLDRLVEINHLLADPRETTDTEALALAAEGVPFYFFYATIHSTEVSNGQAILRIVHRLATADSPEIREIVDNAVILLVPSQNPDGQHLVIDHWYRTRRTDLSRQYPDLYHKYVGHDDNRDWFMFTQKETRMNIELVQKRYKPVVTHDMHQMGSSGFRIFVPPFTDPYDVNIHPIIAMGQATVGQAMATALIAEGKEGVGWNNSFDLWTPARQYMVYHGQPRILTEIASSGRMADPYVNPRPGQPIGPQEARANFPVPYSKETWTLSQMVDYGVTAALAGMSHVAKYGREWLYNFYRVHRDWAAYDGAPFAFVVPADQRDPYATYELLEILEFGEVEIERATADFAAGGRTYPAGSWVIRTAQPYGAFAKTMLERQVYPDLRLFPGGPPEPPYDATAHTLWMLMGVDVVEIAEPFDAALEPVESVAPVPAPVPARPSGAYLIGPESYGVFQIVAELQDAGVPIFRTAGGFESGGTTFAPGTFVVPPTDAARPIVERAASELGIPVHAADQAPRVEGFRLKPGTRVGLWKGANNMPGGWLLWLLEQYGIQHEIVTAQDVAGDLAARFDVILLPSGTTRARIVEGLDPARYDEEWGWAYGVGEAGWTKLADYVRGGGTLLAIGTAVETARALLDLPIGEVLPESPPSSEAADASVAGSAVDEALRSAFSSPAQLMQVLRDRVADPENLFYCPGSLLMNEFDVSHPVAFGMPSSWPVFFETDQAYRLRPGFGIDAEVVSRYPEGDILQSGWLLGEEYLRDQANVVAFTVGDGYVVTYGSQVDFRAQPRATFRLLFNALYHGPSTAVTAGEMGQLDTDTNED